MTLENGLVRLNHVSVATSNAMKIKACLSGWHIQLVGAAFHPAQPSIARYWVARRLIPARGLIRYEIARQALHKLRLPWSGRVEAR